MATIVAALAVASQPMVMAKASSHLDRPLALSAILSLDPAPQPLHVIKLAVIVALVHLLILSLVIRYEFHVFFLKSIHSMNLRKNTWNSYQMMILGSAGHECGPGNFAFS